MSFMLAPSFGVFFLPSSGVTTFVKTILRHGWVGLDEGHVCQWWHQPTKHPYDIVWACYAMSCIKITFESKFICWPHTKCDGLPLKRMHIHIWKKSLIYIVGPHVKLSSLFSTSSSCMQMDHWNWQSPSSIHYTHCHYHCSKASKNLCQVPSIGLCLYPQWSSHWNR